MRFSLIFPMVFSAGTAFAGMPVETPFTCPVGGEEFVITDTMSCSEMGRTMLLRPVTSCDFVTRLPVCPGNGFPAYRDATEEELARLDTLVASED